MDFNIKHHFAITKPIIELTGPFGGSSLAKTRRRGGCRFDITSWSFTKAIDRTYPAITVAVIRDNQYS